MKTLIFAIFATFSTAGVFAGDILTLNNKMVFEGKITGITDCEVVFKAHGKKFTIPASDVYSLKFENTNDKIYRNYLKISNEGLGKSFSEPCDNGTSDAKKYHGKKTLHVFLGLLFGPFAIVGTALSNPTPLKGKHTAIMSENKKQFENPEYLECYKKKAKRQLISMEGWGWFTWIIAVAAVQ
jgi:hypothetical protein